MRQWRGSAELCIALVMCVPLGSMPGMAEPPDAEIKAFVLVPPTNILHGVRRIAVLDFAVDQGGWRESGHKYTDIVITQLLRPDRGIGDVKSGFLGLGSKEGRTLQEGAFTNVFEVVERSRLGQVMAEQRLQVSDWVDQTQAVSFGKLLGVDAIIMGSLEFRTSDENWVGERSQRQGNQTVKVPVNCVTRTVGAGFRARVVNTETGSVLATLESSSSVRDQACQPTLGQLASVQAMAGGLVEDLAVALADQITPHFELQEFDLENIGARQFQDLKRRAEKAAEELNVDDAYVCYSAIHAEDPYSPEVLYNLGLLNEVVGNYRQASEFYEQAVQLKSERRYRQALERAQRSLAFVDALAAIGVQLAGHEFDVSQDRLAEATAVQIEVKGKREDRIPVFAQASEGGEVVAQVPGGVTFTVLGEEGDFYRIRLLGGNEGFIHRSKVKLKD